MTPPDEPNNKLLEEKNFKRVQDCPFGLNAECCHTVYLDALTHSMM